MIAKNSKKVVEHKKQYIWTRFGLDADFDVPHFFQESLTFKIATSIFLWGLSIVMFREVALSLWIFLIEIYPNLIKILLSSENVTRLGLIFQLVGVIAVLPEISKRQNIDQWERWIRTAGEKSEGLSFSFKDLFLIPPSFWFESKGVVRLVNIISQGMVILYFTINLVPHLWHRAINENFLAYGGAIFLQLSLYALWVHATWLDVSLAQEGKELHKGCFYWYISISVLPAIIFFVPVALVILIVLELLRRIALNPIEIILTRATFPFILFGTLLELIASFI